MKKTIVALAILLTCMGFIPIDAANWYWIGADSSGGQWYIDNQSAYKSNGVAVVWVKIEKKTERIYCFKKRLLVTENAHFFKVLHTMQTMNLSIHIPLILG